MMPSASCAVMTAVSGLVREIAGIKLPETLYSQVFSFVAERSSASGIGELLYLERLKSDPEERDLFIQKITIGETFFFRDECQFSLLDRIVFPSLVTGTANPPFRAWSAACSSGEEAVSLALLAMRHSGPSGFSSVEIWASDINRQALETLSQGVFRSGSFRDEGSRYHSLIEPWIASRSPLSVTLDSGALSCVRTARIDLSSCDYSSIPDGLDLVMLRNVLIYFDEAVRTRVIDAIARKLKTGGLLFLSASEVPLFEHNELELGQDSGVYYFVKTEKKKKQSLGSLPSAGVPESGSPAVGALLGYAARKDGRRTAKMDQKAAPGVQASLSSEASLHRPDPLFERLEKCFTLANTGETAAARSELGWDCPDGSEIQPEAACGHPAILFLAGYIFLCEGSTGSALALFDRCLALFPAFWLARYHRAVLSASRDSERSRLDFACVVRDISRAGRSSLSGADFLLEGFDCKYYRDISEKWTAKLSGKGARNGH